jgi:hypothetical protein
VVQQLTRYYHAFKTEAPFGDEVDLSQPIRLMAIAPGFHQDTLIDCQYNLLELELISFQIQAQADCLYLELTQLETSAASRLLLQQGIHTPTSEVSVPEPSRKLLNWLSYVAEADSKAIIDARQQILSFDERMKEVVEPQRFRYGKGKGRPCAEIFQVQTLPKGPKWPAIALWLPDPEGKSRILRIVIETDQTGIVVKRLCYCPHKDKMKNWWFLPQFNQFGEDYRRVPLAYQPLMDEHGKFLLSSLVEMALNTWLGRI